MSQRRYGEEEVREIFSLATSSDSRELALPSDPDGLTLDELQRIGQEAAIEPARVAQAAKTLDARGRSAPAEKSLGLPMRVSRVIDLPRAPTDREWEQLVSECRTTFGAQGRVTTSGGLREWSHGSLHVSVEPSQHGELLRVSSYNDDAVAFNVLGFGTSGLSIFVGAVAAAAGKAGTGLVILGVLGGTAVSAFVANAIRAPRWARVRQRQMDQVAEHAVNLLSGQ